MFEKPLDVLQHLMEPIRFMALAGTYIPSTIYSLLTCHQYSDLRSPSGFKDAWFARFWSTYGPLIRADRAPQVAPLFTHLHGVVLDIGPGSGEWLSLFPKDHVTKIYGVEPNRDHHAALRKQIERCGLEGVYEIVPVGIEDLGRGRWVKEETVDGVVTVLCLCSVPR
ncbi:hypothetical protein LSUE1_G007962, partial [Lachnellula suecica]